MQCVLTLKKNALKKPPTKKELEQENKALKWIYEALEEENKINNDKIKSLQEEVLALLNPKSIEAVQKGTQTDDEDLLFCEECEFPAETLYKLGEHTGEFYTGLKIPWDFCSNIYVDKETLMKHEINEHKESSIQILLSILTIFGAENRAKMTILGADFMQWPNLLH